MWSISRSDPIAIAARGREIDGLGILGETPVVTQFHRREALNWKVRTDLPTGGVDKPYGQEEHQRFSFWRAKPDNAYNSPLVLFVHGGGWRNGTYRDALGCTKVDYFNSRGYSFATVNYRHKSKTDPKCQIQEVANALAYMIQSAGSLGFDPRRIILMGHGLGAYFVTLLGTVPTYLGQARVDLDVIKAVISLDGSNYNAVAEIMDKPPPEANLSRKLGTHIPDLWDMSPTFNARPPNAPAFLLLHTQHRSHIRQAIELSAVFYTANTLCNLHVFEGQNFEGYTQMLLRLGDPAYPATMVMERWLNKVVPVIMQ